MPRYIDADALKSYLNEREYADMYYIEALFGIIDRQPTISPDEVRGVGEWLPDVGEFGFPEIPCSVCGYKSGHYGFNYCPNCGAKMEVSEDA